MKKYTPAIRTCLLAAFAVAATVLAGTQKAAAQSELPLSLPSTHLTAGRLLDEIEHQTGYTAAYDNTIFDISREADMPSSETTLGEALGAMLSGSGFSYIIRSEYIAIVPAKEAPQAPSRSIYTGPRTSDVYRRSRIEDLDASPRRRSLPPPRVFIADTTAVEQDDHRSEDLPDFTSNDVSLRSFAVKPLPLVSLKTNLLHAATLTPNLGMDIGLGHRTSLELFAAYNPWNREGTLDSNKKIAHLVLRPEFRWWFCERLNGHFLGLNAFYWQYNIGGHDVPLFGFRKSERYEGWAVGASLTYGYHLSLHKRWGLEFSISAGAARMSRDIYDCSVCSGVSDSGAKWYFGPTNASASLVFIIR